MKVIKKNHRNSQKIFHKLQIKKLMNNLTSVCLVFQVGHCAIGKCQPLPIKEQMVSQLIVKLSVFSSLDWLQEL